MDHKLAGSRPATHLRPSAPRLHIHVPGTGAPRHLQCQQQQHTTGGSSTPRQTRASRSTHTRGCAGPCTPPAHDRC